MWRLCVYLYGRAGEYDRTGIALVVRLFRIAFVSDRIPLRFQSNVNTNRRGAGTGTGCRPEPGVLGTLNIY